MNKEEFSKFVKEKNAKAKKETEIDWNQQRDEWIIYVEKLYKTIEEYLEDFKQNGEVIITYEDKFMEEELIGKYYIKKQYIKIGNDNIVLDPVGTLLIGTKGRVEMSGPHGTFPLILADSRSRGPTIKVKIWDMKSPEPPDEEDEIRGIEWSWKIVTKNVRVKFEDFSEENFLQAVAEVANG